MAKFESIFFSSTLEHADRSCQTIGSLKEMFDNQSESLKALLNAGFQVSISENKRPTMYASDQREWERYGFGASGRFVYSKFYKYVKLSSHLNKEALQKALSDSLDCYNKLMELFFKTKELYFYIKLNEIWPDYREISISRVDWSDISVNTLEKFLAEFPEIITESGLTVARNSFKRGIIEGILAAPSLRATPPSGSWPGISLYD